MTRTSLLQLSAAALVAAVAVVGFWWWRAPEAARVGPGLPAPELELYSIGARAPTRLGQFRGRPVLLAMFADRCPACDEVLPRLERIHREFGKRGLVVLGVSTDLDAWERVQFVRRRGLTFFVLQDPGGAAIRQAFGTTRLPELYAIDARGTIRAVYLGRLAEREPELRERVEALLAEARRSTSPTR